MAGRRLGGGAVMAGRWFGGGWVAAREEAECGRHARRRAGRGAGGGVGERDMDGVAGVAAAQCKRAAGAASSLVRRRR